MVTAIIAAVGAALSLAQAGVQASEKDKDFQRSNTCVYDYEKKAKEARDRMWASTIFTPERAAYEQKALAWQKKADEARIKGCPAPKPTAMEQASFQPSIPAPSTDNTSTYLALGVGFLALSAVTYAVARRSSR